MPVGTILEGGALRVIDYRCTAGPHDRPFIEQHHSFSISYVRRVEMERQTLIAVPMLVVGAEVLVVRSAEQKRAGDQLEGASARHTAETAAAHVGDREAVVLLEERAVVRTGAAAVIDDAQRAALEDGANGHDGAMLPARPRRSQPEHREISSGSN